MAYQLRTRPALWLLLWRDQFGNVLLMLYSKLVDRNFRYHFFARGYPEGRGHLHSVPYRTGFPSEG